MITRTVGENAAWIEGYENALQYLQRMGFWQRVFFLFFWKQILTDDTVGKKQHGVDEVDDIIHEAKERADGACIHCIELKKKGVVPENYPHHHEERGGGES